MSPHRLGKPLFPPASLKLAISKKPEFPAEVHEFVYKRYLAKFLFANAQFQLFLGSNCK